MAVRIGINPITWTNDDVPELGGNTPLETCLAEIRAGRLSRHRTRRQVSAESAELAKALGGHELRLVSGW